VFIANKFCTCSAHFSLPSVPSFSTNCTPFKVKSAGLLTLREEHKLRLFENRVLRKMFWARRQELAGDWRKMHNEELNDLCSSPNIVLSE